MSQKDRFLDTNAERTTPGGDEAGRGSEDDGGLKTASPQSRKRQIQATFCATLGCLLNGSVIGYTGPAIPSLMNKTPNGGRTLWETPIELEAQEASWIAGLLSVGCFVGCLLAGPTMEYFGRRTNLLVFTSCLYLAGFFLILLAGNSGMVLAGRFLNGMGLGFVLATTSVYIVEIATTDLRGFLGCFVQFQGSFGVLLLFSAGCFLNWWQLAVLKICLVVPFVVGMYFSPESPRWLFAKGLDAEARESLEWLRGGNSPPSAIRNELKTIKMELEKKAEAPVSVRALFEGNVWKPFMISVLMMFFLNFSGLNVMIFYCNTIFYYSKAEINPNAASVIVGFVLLFSCVAAIIFITRLGRKVILLVSMAGMSLCYAVLGGCFYAIEVATEEAKTQNLVEVDMGSFPTWLPPLSIVLLLFLGNGGYGTLIWVVTAELLPPHVRTIANSIIICFAFVMGFIASKTFVDFVLLMGASGTFWMYGSVCLLGTIFTAVWVPETRGKTVEEIAALFK